MGTIGQTSTGTNQDAAYILDYLFLRKDQLTVSGQRFTKVTAYIHSAGTSDVRGVLYAADGSGGIPGTLLASKAVSISAGTAWIDFTFATPYEAATGYYWHGVHFGTDAVAFNAVATSGVTGCYKTDTYSDGSPSPYGSAGSNWPYDQCCYLTYEAVPASGISIPLLNHLLLGD